MINETTNLTSQIKGMDASNNEVQIGYMSATLNNGNQNITTNVVITNKVLASSNAQSVKTQYQDFMTAISARAQKLGFVIFI